MIRCHCGSGLIYLTDGFVNVDVIGSGAGLAKDHPAAVKKWGTTSDAYYARMSHVTQEQCERGLTPDYSQQVVDCYGSFMAMPFDDESVSEILSRQVFEHLSITEARMALMESRRVLVPGGILRISVPDIPATLEKYRETGENFFKRHLTGTQRNSFGWHCMSWSRSGLIGFLEEYGFACDGDDVNPHFYPSICLKFSKVPHESDREVPRSWNAAHEYCGDPLGTPLQPVEGEVLEIGPGSAPLPWATTYVDVDRSNLDRIEGKETVLANVEQLPQEWDKRFAFCFASHILEHVEDPIKAASELSRVAKRGVVVCPSVCKDSLFVFHEADHKWMVLPSLKGWRDTVHSDVVSGWIHRALRYSDHRFGPDAVDMKKFFIRAEPHLDVIHHWEGTLRIEVIG